MNPQPANETEVLSLLVSPPSSMAHILDQNSLCKNVNFLKVIMMYFHNIGVRARWAGGAVSDHVTGHTHMHNQMEAMVTDK